MSAHWTAYLAQALTDDVSREANSRNRLMAHELRTSRRAARRRRKFRS